MERISVTDFGPIQHAEIEIKPFCILIGHTSSGEKHGGEAAGFI